MTEIARDPSSSGLQVDSLGTPRCDRCRVGCSGHVGGVCTRPGCRCPEPRHRGLPAGDKQAEPDGWGTRLRLAQPQRGVTTIAGGLLLSASFDRLAPVSASQLEACERAIRLLADLLYDRDRQATCPEGLNHEADREAQALRRLADGMLRQIVRVVPETETATAASATPPLPQQITAADLEDRVICAVRDEARATGDRERSRCCSAALGLPTGDGAGGLLDRETCRARVAVIVSHNLSCGLDTYGVRATLGGLATAGRS